MDGKRLEIIRERVEQENLSAPLSWYNQDVSELLDYIEHLENNVMELEDYSNELEEDIQNMRAGALQISCCYNGSPKATPFM